MKNEFIYPDFNNSLVNIPHSILAHYSLPHSKPELKTPLLHQIKDCSKLILFLIDGFGYNLFKKEATKFPFFKKIDNEKLIERITTIFPSTTAAGITTINSGLTPKEHGLLKWNLYFQEVDAILQPLPYKFIPTPYHTNGISLPKDTKMLFNNVTTYELLKKGNVPSFYFIPKILKDAVYTKSMSKGAIIIQYISITDLFLELSKILQETHGKAFFYVYWEIIDAQEHVYGPWTKNVNAEIELFDSMIQQFINNLDNKTRKDTALLITADHGQYPIKPEETIYINQFPEIIKNFKRSINGIPIPPTGKLTIVSEGYIKDNSTNATLQPWDTANGILFYSAKGYTTKANRAKYTGVIYAPTTQINGAFSNTTFNGSLYSKTVSFGSGTSLTAYQAAGFPTTTYNLPL